MLSVRPSASDDWFEYRRVRLCALKESPEAFGSTWEQEVILPDEGWSARTVASASGHSGRGFFAVHDDKVCGLAWCLLSDMDPRMAHLYAMWASPTVRGRGAGRALLEQCIAWAKSKGVHNIRLSVNEGKQAAMQLYKSRGFYQVGETELLRKGWVLTIQELQLDLDMDA